MSKNVAFFIEIREGKIRNGSFEAATVARNIASEIGGSPVGIAVGSGFGSGLSEFGEFGIPEIYTVDNEILNHYTCEGYSAAVGEFVKKHAPGYLIITASAMGKDLAPRIAAKLDVELISDIIDYKLSGEKIEAVKPIFSGKARITLSSDSPFQFVTLRPKIFLPSKDSETTCTIKSLDFDLTTVKIRAHTKEIIKGSSDKFDQTEADVIVSGGRGMQDPKNFEIIEKLADAVGGVVGASRAVVDSGCRPHSEQIGQTGKTVTPGLYIAVGISGAIQHLAGMSSSKCIVAINKDPDAPIFKVADYGIVGDLFEIVPRLTEEFNKILM